MEEFIIKSEEQEYTFTKPVKIKFIGTDYFFHLPIWALKEAIYFYARQISENADSTSLAISGESASEHLKNGLTVVTPKV